MMKALLRKNLTCLFLEHSSSVHKCHFPFSLSVLHFSTSRQSKPSNSPAVFEFLLHKHHFSPEVASYVASVLTLLKDPEKSDSILSFFKEVGFTHSQLEKTLKFRPSLLLANLDKIIKPKIKIFQDLGFSSGDIADIISKEPGILHTSANNRVIPALSLLKDMLGSHKEVARALRKSGWLLVTDLEKNMVPNIEFLRTCGISMEQITVLLNYLPRFLLYKPEILRKYVEKVDEMGVERSSRMYVYALGVVGSMTNGIWEHKLQAFRNILGFTEDDITRVLRQTPQVFAVSEEKMNKVKEVLLATGKYDISCIVKYPKSLMYSIEKRYNRRFEVLYILESRQIIKKWPCLSTLCRTSDDKFFQEFVVPNLSEVGHVYLLQSAVNGKRE